MLETHVSGPPLHTKRMMDDLQGQEPIENTVHGSNVLARRIAQPIVAFETLRRDRTDSKNQSIDVAPFHLIV